MRYFKMNGAGNDFVIFDARAQGTLSLSPAQARAIADRETGVGCDQVIAIERSIRADAFMRIWNAQGGEVAACGNATRCVTWLLLEQGQEGDVTIETAAGVLRAARAGGQLISVDMGSPLLKWEDIPLVRAMDTARLDFAARAPGGAWLEHPGAVNMGNPHVVFFVSNADAAPVREVGAQVEKDAVFPEGVNVGFAEIRRRDEIRLRVWERGAGETKACGTGACAAVVAAHRAGLAERKALVIANGGELLIDWRAFDDRVIMTGPVEFEGGGDLAP